MLFLSKSRNIRLTSYLLFFSLATSGCKKLLEVSPPVTSTNSANVYTSDLTAAAVLTGIYINMSQKELTAGGITSLSLYTGMSSDELTLYNGIADITYSAYYTNALDNANTGNADFWRNIYPVIFTANSAIEGLSENSGTLTPAVKQQLSGEAKFIRAFCYFYLVNLYGDIPMAISSDYEVNRLLSRTPKEQIYRQIIKDLKEAQSSLSTNYLKADALTPYPQGSEERVRPTMWAATALLSRVYLYAGNYAAAESEATKIIDNSSIFSLTSLDNTFLKNSTEAIWQLQPVNNGWNTEDAKVFILNTTPTSMQPVYLSNFLLNAFETGDNRKTDWVGIYTDNTSDPLVHYYYPNKYKISLQGAPVDEYAMVLRLAEQYLIRAEARAQRNNTTGSQSDLNVIRSRAGLASTTANDKTSLINAILHERQIEFFGEWGHRWLDIKRINSIGTIMESVTTQKGGSWSTNWQWYPIPLSELQRNPKLIQNAGY